MTDSQAGREKECRECGDEWREDEYWPVRDDIFRESYEAVE